MNEVSEQLGEIRADIKWIRADATKKNGYIADLMKRTENNKIDIVSLKNDNGKLFKEMSNLIGRMHLFLEAQEKKEDRKKNWLDNVTSNIAVWIIAALLGGICTWAVSKLF